MWGEKFFARLERFWGRPLGQAATAFFLLAGFTGILLATLYDVTQPFHSLSHLLVSSSAGAFLRNLHYWSGQFLIITVLVHVWEQLARKTDRNIRSGLWWRLTLGLVIVLLVNLSGFMLRADADAEQALRILVSLLESIPLIGSAARWMLVGREDQPVVLYINHAATFTILLALIIFEHAKPRWPRLVVMFISTLIVFILALFFTPLLRTKLDLVNRGPWYFLGFQELLHHFSRPLWPLVFGAGVVLLLGTIRRKSDRVRNTVIAVIVSYITLSGLVYYTRGANWQLLWPTKNTFDNFQVGVVNPLGVSQDTVLFVGNEKRAEGCLTCHHGLVGFSPSHSPQAVGCFSCHRGNPYTLDKNMAHRGMILIPGDLSNAPTSCGQEQCHPDQPARVQNSLMNQVTGMIAVDRFAFGELDFPNDLAGIHDVKDSPADTHLRQLCLHCHLGQAKKKWGRIDENSRGGGCLACHLRYSDSTSVEVEKRVRSGHWSTADGPLTHPALSALVGDEHCLGCHSRSGRISLSYQGWHETGLDSVKELSDSLRILADGRISQYIRADIHHEQGLGCTDCHLAREVMGDNHAYQHEEEAEKISCTDCHFHQPVQVVGLPEFDEDSKRLINSLGRKLKSAKVLATAKDQLPLLNTYQQGGKWYLEGKFSGQSWLLKPPPWECTAPAHERLECNACHAQWAPQCIGCHTAFEPDSVGRDNLTGAQMHGHWQEYAGDFLAEPPVLGIRYLSPGDTVISPFIPGMIMTMDKGPTDKKGNTSAYFRRLYAPISPHTTGSESRECRSCHISSLATGFGRGYLELVSNGSKAVWLFTPKYAPGPDGLPWDAWVSLDGKGGGSTRTNTGPLTESMRRRLLEVGVCLTCHEKQTGWLVKAQRDFNSLLNSRAPVCKTLSNQDWLRLRPR